MKFDLHHTFLTSDHHFKSYDLPISSMAVFSKDEEDVLIDKWNSVVTSDDTVIYVGDFCDGTVLDAIEYRKRLNGNIILVKGNHDKFPDDVYRIMFQDVYDSLYLDDLNISIAHHPNNNIDIKHIHGHKHRLDIFDEKISSNNIFCTCVSKNNGYPISLNDILISIC